MRPHLLFWLVSAAAFICHGAESSASLRPWTRYKAILWTEDTARKNPEKLPLFYQRMSEMGVNTGMVYGGEEPGHQVSNAIPFYVENVVNRGLCLKWNSPVTDWDKFIKGWMQNGRPDSALVRDYCLDDPAWLSWARTQMRQQAVLCGPHQPIAYDIRDELSVTFSANPFDYDFNPAALAGFRAWLRQEYGDLAKLNAMWETRFGTWDDVRPFTTDQIKNRMGSGEALPKGQPDWKTVQRLTFDWASARQSPTRWNFSPWADFRTYMDVSLARTLESLRQAAHEVDPATPVGIEGTQMPHAFGGYNLWRLSQALDWVEPYDICDAREIFGSFLRGPIVTTVFEKETRPATRRLWHLLLEGDRGCIVWWSKDCIDWQRPDWPLTEKARALAPVLKEMTSPLGTLFLRAKRVRDPVFIHYSQASIQAAWLLESTVDGPSWVRRFSSFEAEHSRIAKVRDSWLKLFQDLGYSPQFIATEQIESGALRQQTNAVLVLPSSWALSDKEAREIIAFAGTNGAGRGSRSLVVWDGTPGVFNQHCRLRATNSLPWLPEPGQQGLVGACIGGKTSTHAGDIAEYRSARLGRPAEASPWIDWLGAQLEGKAAPVRAPDTARLRVHRLQIAGEELLGVERNIDYKMSEALSQAGGNESLERELQAELHLPEARHVFNLRTGEYLGQVTTIRCRIDPWQPSLFALMRNKAPTQGLIQSLLESADP